MMFSVMKKIDEGSLPETSGMDKKIKKNIRKISTDINNRAMVKAYHESKKDPLGFFLSFDEITFQIIPQLLNNNMEVLHSMSLYSYSILVNQINSTNGIVTLDVDLSNPSKKLIVEPLWAKHSISSKSLSLLTMLFKKMKTKFSKRGKMRLLFLSFENNPELAKTLPVLPLEWLTKFKSGGILSTAIHTYVDEEIGEKDDKKSVSRQQYNETLQKGLRILCKSMILGWTSLCEIYQAHLSLNCSLTTKGPERVCEKHPETKTPIGKKFLPTLEFSKKTLVTMAHECGLPDATIHSKRSELCSNIERYQPFNIALDYFKQYFHQQLMETFQKDPKYMIMLKGGYNLKTLLRHKFHSTAKIFTSDLDFGISSVGAKWGLKRTISYWDTELRKFINQNEKTRSDFSLVRVDIKDPTERDFGLTCILQLRFQNEDFVDFSFFKEPISPQKLDRKVSFMVGLPVKKFNYALYEILNLILRENVPGMDDHTYKNRNPFSGKKAVKGIRDLYRARVACEALKNNPRVKVSDRPLLIKICKLSKFLTYAHLKETKKKDRLDFFQKIIHLIEKLH